jgi:hypothetical protein
MFNEGGYWLVGTEVEPVIDFTQWGVGFEKSEKRIARTKFPEAIVSTVFLGLDHNFDDDENAPPILFETMVFPIVDDIPQMGEIYGDRCSTYAEALRMHTEGMIWYMVHSLVRPPESIWDLICGIVRGYWPVFKDGRWIQKLMSLEDFMGGAEMEELRASSRSKLYPLIQAESYPQIVNAPPDAVFEFVEAAS